MIVISHTDHDHYSLTARIRQLSDAKVAMHARERDFIGSRYFDRDRIIKEILKHFRKNGVPHEAGHTAQHQHEIITRWFPPVMPDIVLQGGEHIPVGEFDFQVIWTPGHRAGHICLYEPQQKILFSGDCINETMTPHIWLLAEDSINPLTEYIDSLEKIKKLDVKLILSGHGPPFSDLLKRADELIQLHKERNELILEILREKPKTSYQVGQEIIWVSARNSHWKELPLKQEGWNELQALAHLESLRYDNKVTNFINNNVVYYKRA